MKIDECGLCGQPEREHQEFSLKHYYQKHKSADAIGIMARFETPNYLIEAFGFTHAQALEVLRAAWAKHAKQTGADPNYLEEFMSDVQYIDIIIGTALRDREEFYREKRRLVIPTHITL